MNDIIRCPHCDLNQFETKNGMCRKCHQPLIRPDTPEEIAAEEAPGETMEVKIDYLKRAIAKTIHAVRKRKKITQDDLAQAIGNRRSYVSKVENGHTLPKICTLTRLCDAMSISLFEFWLEVELGPIDEFTIELIEQLPRLTEDQRETIIALARRVAA